MPPLPRPQRDILLDAAESVAAREGVARLTFDAVAAEAGVSKGGLIHYFASKEQMIEGMVQRSADRWRECFMSAYERAPLGPGRVIRGMLANCFLDAESWTEGLRRSYAAVFAALANNPELVAPMQRVYAELYLLIENDGLPEGVADVLMTAMDGLWLYWVMHLRPVDQSTLDRMRRVLERILQQAISESTDLSSSSS